MPTSEWKRLCETGADSIWWKTPQGRTRASSWNISLHLTKQTGSLNKYKPNKFFFYSSFILLLCLFITNVSCVVSLEIGENVHSPVFWHEQNDRHTVLQVERSKVTGRETVKWGPRDRSKLKKGNNIRLNVYSPSFSEAGLVWRTESSGSWSVVAATGHEAGLGLWHVCQSVIISAISTSGHDQNKEISISIFKYWHSGR